MRDYDYLIVGSGLFGATFAYLASRAGKRCLVIDKRPHLGGNIHCGKVEGITVHEYGAHIFHTSDREVWELANSIVPFNSFINSPVANFEGRLYNLPFNMNTFRQMWGVTTPEEAKAIIGAQREEARSAMGEASEPRNLEEQALLMVGRDIYERLVKGYTEKQWGKPCPELPAFIIKRLPLRFEYDNNYFDDRWQGIPVGGYNYLTEGLLDGVETRTGCDFFEDRPYWESLAEKVVFSGRIDEFYGFRFGELEYRSLRFETETLDTPDYQGRAVMNFTSKDVPYTRVIEHKHFESVGESVGDNPRTVVTREYPSGCGKGREPYYPIPDERNNSIFMKYKSLADREERYIFGGRLAEYRYLDMAPVMRRALDLWNK